MNNRDAMHLDVFEFAQRGHQCDGELALDALPRLAQSRSAQPAETVPLRPLAFHIEGFLDERRRPSARLALDGEIDLVCDRCGKPLRWPLAAEARYFFVHSEDELARLPVDDVDEEPLLGTTRFDLRALIEDEAILALPMSPRHEHCEPAVELPAASDEVADQAPQRPHPFAQLEKLKSRRS